MSRIEHKSPYGPRRAAAYQKPTDQIDAIYKGFVAIRDANIPGLTLPQATLDWLDHVAEVKAALPKPASP